MLSSTAEPTQQIDKRHFDLSKTYSDPDASKATILRGWLEDTWLRSPPGLLVPLRSAALTRALAVWRDLTSGAGLNVSDIVVVGFDANGESCFSLCKPGSFSCIM